ncbi:hypothetical protein J8F10_00030 [Gemmata sp. G18]|uniref:EF-hand domain-containing protein n=1 Tax=Gemmata palustris TaxID=2822762 RepID=A0ABS5BJ03_9BACT|nr:hypothetical protein [Gemmata palustris]MBP3953689.1 hypothetical protein [Gemmata palustris]
MAKSKETNVPLISALVFFVLTTIAFGVMWYLSFSEMETHVNAKKTAEKDLAGVRTAKDEAERLARVYRIYLGAAKDDDVTAIEAESKAGDKIAGEIKQLNDAMASKMATSVDREQKEAKEFVDKKLPTMTEAALREYVTAEKLNDSITKLLTFWQVDANGKANKPSSQGLMDQVAYFKNGDAAYTAAAKERDNYRAQVALLAADAKALKAVAGQFKSEIDKLPAEVKSKIDAVVTGFDKRTADYVKAEAAAGKSLTEAKDELDKVKRDLFQAQKRVDVLTTDNQKLFAEKSKSERETFTFDEPQGKILRKVPGTEGVVEINLGSAAGVRPGLTFTVLPTDFPEKGRQSRVRVLRVPDGKGGYKSVETFVPKGSIEIYEVVNERLSLARIQSGSELDPIRDGVTSGDLLYNSVWRKGVADHIALVGIFDVNGDGTDDIESVVRDLTKMGIPVDAYFDMKKRAWVGQVTERTRYIVEGYFPINAALDANREDKTKLSEAMSKAINDAKQKGVNSVNFRDFFGRMGYKFRLDVTDDKINQATVPYLGNVGVGMPLTPPEK